MTWPSDKCVRLSSPSRACFPGRLFFCPLARGEGAVFFSLMNSMGKIRPGVAALVIAMAGGHGIAGECFLVVDSTSGRILDSEAAGENRQVASLTKIATAVVALEWIASDARHDGEFAPVEEEALRGGANPLGLQPGDRISLRSALLAAMMASDNSSASVIARYIGDAVSGPDTDASEAFVSRMNDLAKRLGMVDTRFVNPHGLDLPGETGVSTARDMALLACHALRVPGFVELAGTRTAEAVFLREGQERTVSLTNTNRLLGTGGVDGMKTGTTSLSGPCLIATASRAVRLSSGEEERRLVAVLLDADGDRFARCETLLEEGFRRLSGEVPAGRRSDTKERLPISEK